MRIAVNQETRAVDKCVSICPPQKLTRPKRQIIYFAGNVEWIPWSTSHNSVHRLLCKMLEITLLELIFSQGYVIKVNVVVLHLFKYLNIVEPHNIFQNIYFCLWTKTKINMQDQTMNNSHLRRFFFFLFFAVHYVTTSINQEMLTALFFQGFYWSTFLMKINGTMNLTECYTGLNTLQDFDVITSVVQYQSISYLYKGHK